MLTIFEKNLCFQLCVSLLHAGGLEDLIIKALRLLQLFNELTIMSKDVPGIMLACLTPGVLMLVKVIHFTILQKGICHDNMRQKIRNYCDVTFRPEFLWAVLCNFCIAFSKSLRTHRKANDFFWSGDLIV